MAVFRVFRVGFDNLEELVATVMLLVIVAVEAIQVVSRSLLDNALDWPESLAASAFVWLTFLGSIGALKRGSNVGVDLLQRRLAAKPSKVRRRVAKVLAGVVGAIICLFAAVFGYEGWNAVLNTSYAMPTLGVSYRWVYSATPLFSVLLIIRTAQTVCGYRFSRIEDTWGSAEDTRNSEVGIS